MASVRHVVDLIEDDDDEVPRSMNGNAASQSRLDLRDDSEIVATGKSSWSSSLIELALYGN
jgi:membrane-bound ClpP family serine protease